jgi:sulfotransferase family protein
MDQGPIFVGGLDSSGKSLMRLSLSAHPHFAMSRRTYMWTRFYNRYGALSQPDNFERCLAAMLRHKPVWVLNPDPDRIRREFWQGEPTYARLFALFHQHYAEQLGRPRWGDQLAFVERYADVIFAAYPSARMIHMIRDPRDRYAASVPPSQRRRGQVGGATARWLDSVRLARRNQQRYSDRYKIVRYEALLSRREETLREVCDFVDEEFVPAMLTLEGAIRFGSVDADRADDELERDMRINTAHPEADRAMPEREIAFMQAYAKRDMVSYGYQPEPIRFSFGDRLAFYLVDWPANLVGMVAWRSREGGWQHHTYR